MGARPTWASTYKFLLWYPGAEGSSSQAAPLLEDWMNYLTERGLPVKLEAVYHNDAITSDIKLKKIKPAVAILSLEGYIHLSTKHSLSLLAQTRKQPAGDGSNQYTILKNSANKTIEKLYLSEPLTEDFVRKIILRNTPQHSTVKLEYAPQALRTLKKIGQGEIAAAILINAYEAKVLEKIKTDWSRQLKPVSSSPKLPAPPLILFEDWKKGFPHDKFVSLLMAMPNDEEGKEILHELRMKGFMKPNQNAYEALRKTLEAP